MTPLLNVAEHVMQAKPVRRSTCNCADVVERLSSPDALLVVPGPEASLGTRPCSILPLGLSGQPVSLAPKPLKYYILTVPVLIHKPAV